MSSRLPRTNVPALVSACLLLALAALLAACGDNSQDAGTQASGSSTSKPVRVYVLLPSLESDSYVREKKGAEAQARRMPDVDVTIDAGTSRQNSPAAMLPKLEAAITKQYDVIAINAGGSDKELAPVLARAAAQGMKIVTFDQDVPQLGDKRQTYIEWNARKAGGLTGEYISDQLGGRGQVGVIRCAIGNALLDSVEAGFREAIAGSDVEVVGRGDGFCDIARSRTIAENMLTANPRLKAFFADTDLGAQGAQQALEGAGTDLIVTGTGGGADFLSDIEQGKVIDATATFPFELFGKRAIEAAVAAARGEQLPARTTMDSELVTKENAAEAAQAIQDAQR